MLQEFFNQIMADPLLVMVSALMFCLFFYDLAGVIARLAGWPRPRHADFKGPLVQLGIFGTFFGILGGLYGFDTSDTAHSVPKMLDGLKFAFATSVLGMVLSLLLNVLHKLTGIEEGETGILHSIDRRLATLTHRVSALATSIESPTELISQFTEMKGFLIEHLKQINDSLNKALAQLATGATKEVIRALEEVIKEFNRNLEAQFGENFKELNAACLKLVEWQRNYREHVDSTESYLTKIRKALEQSAQASADIVSSNEATLETCRQVAALIKTYDIESATLSAHLESCKRLGEEAKTFLVTSEQALTAATNNLTSFSNTIESTVGKQSEVLSELTEDLAEKLPKALGELENVLTGVTNQFARDYRTLFEFMTAKR